MAIRYLSGINVDSNTLFVDDANNRVGIGTASPSYKLQVNLNSDDRLAINQTAANNFGLQFQYNGTRTWDIYNSGQADSNLLFYNQTLGGNAVVFTSAGNVGIGTTSPGYKLDVTGDINFTSTLKFGGVNVIHGTFADIYANIRVIRNASTSVSDGMYIGYDNSGGASGHLRFFANGTNERMRIDASTGNVGIGTTSPAYKLDVSGTARVTSTLLGGGRISAATEYRLNDNSYSRVAILDGAGAFAGGYNFNINSDFPQHDSTGAVSAYYYHSAGYISLFTNSSQAAGTAASERLRITSAGNVGIGTTSPTTILAISQASPIVTINSSDASQFHGIEFRNGNTLDAFIKQLPQTSEFRISNGRGASWGGHITFYTDTVERMRIASTGATRLNAYGSGSFTGTVAYNLAVDSSGNIIETAGGVVDGSGTANYVTKWIDGNTVGNSLIYDDGTTITFQTGASERMRITSAGEVLIGTTTDSGEYKLQVNGRGLFQERLVVNDTPNDAQVQLLGNGTNIISIQGRTAAGAGSSLIAINNDGGNTSIGTTASLSRLTVLSDSSAQTLSLIGRSGDNISTIRWWNNAGNTIYTAIESNANYTIYNTVTNGYAAFQTNNSERMRIAADGNIGVGTTSPFARLQVNSGNIGAYNNISTDGAQLYLGDTNFSNSSYWNSAPGIGAVYAPGTSVAGDLAFYVYTGAASSRTERMRIVTGGNVGIGTTSPAYKLDVAGTISNNSEQNFIYATYDDVAALFQRVGTFGAVIKIGRKGVSNSTTIDYPADGTFAVSTAGLERLRITSAGNVGIGTTSPQVKLEVRGAQDNTIVPANAVAKFVGGDAGIFVGNLAGTPNYGAWLQAMRESDGLVFPLHLQPNGGNVGIGTTSPVTTLQVNATSPAIRLQETGSGGDKRLDLSVNSSGVATIAANQSAQVLTFETVGSERMRITNAGNIFFNATSAVSFETFGVAHQWSRFYTTSSTDYALVDVGNATTRVRIGVDSSTGGSLATGTSAYASYVGSSGSYPLQLGSYGGVAITINSSNNVGIGTTSPSTNLHVAGSVRVSGNSTNRLDLDGGVRITGQYYANSNTEYTYIDMYNNANASINIGTKHPLSYISFESGSGAYTERMRITNTGNVGIGTTSPANTLQIGSVGATGYSGNRLAVGDGTNVVALHPGAVSYLTANGDIVIGAGDNTTNQVYVKSGGNVGIGTTSPGAKLDVNGDAWFTNGGNLNAVITQGAAGKGRLYLYDGGNATIALQTNGASYFNAGNVGIGTTSPANKLVAVADATFNGENTYAIAAASLTDVAYKTIVGYDYANDVGVISAVRTGIGWKNLSILPVGNTNLGVGTISPSERLHVSGNIRVTGAYYDSNNSAGSSGQVLSSTGSGTDWVSLSEITGVDGTGTANYIAKWSDTDTITNSQIRDDGTTVGVGQAPAAAKMSVNGALNVGGRYLYNNFQSSLDTTGVAVAGLSASTNGDSAFFTFEAGASNGQYQRIVWSCYNTAGDWNVVKVIDEGTNAFDVVASASSGATITFTWKSRSGALYYTPRLIITGVGSINTSYL